MAVPDLLRQRRIELGLPAVSPPLRPVPVILGIGAGIGALFVLIVLTVYWQLINREQALQQMVDRLTPVEQRVAQTQARIQKCFSTNAHGASDP